MQVTFWEATESVTGSRFLVDAAGRGSWSIAVCTRASSVRYYHDRQRQEASRVTKEIEMQKSPKPEQIAVGIDGSVGSRAAVRWALAHAREGDTVTLVHAWEPAPPSADAMLTDVDVVLAARAFTEREVAHARNVTHAQGVTIVGRTVEGPAKRCLTEIDCDLLVVGAREHRGLADWLLGSVTKHLATQCAVPVVIVPSYERAGRLAEAAQSSAQPGLA